MKSRYKITIFFEIFLIVTLSIATSYLIAQSSKNALIIEEQEKTSKIGNILAVAYALFVNKIIGSKGLVSAETLAIQTCLKGKDGAICQEYTSLTACKTGCNETFSACVPAARKDVAQCKLGTCYDKIEGTCQPRSPKAACENGGGQWLADENGNALQCKKGCCVLSGDRTFFSTAQECTRKASVLGATKTFKPEIKTELACLILANSQEEGACIIEQDFEKTCKFTTKASCMQIKGDFRAGYLCSAPELKTNCKSQTRTGCADGKDEIYWFDSCGNKENIYDANKVKSFNNGKVLSKNESCSIGSLSNPLSGRGNCGNCNYLFGSRCGLKTATEKLSDSSQQFVCRDLRCKSSDGKIRENGESWCAYQGAIGTEKDATGEEYRGIETAGSRHFREVCIDGEVRIEPCADYRNEICVEEKAPITTGKTFSSAACRINRWQQCIEYNTQVKNSKNQNGISNEQRDDKCNKNPDCFVKKVNIADNFHFNICAPRYAPGFDLSSNAEGGETVCGMASMKCTAVQVKKLGGWKWVANAGCVTPEFTKQMNDFCMSLGDCGAKVNYIGDLSESYRVSSTGEGGQKLDSTYLDKLKTYSNVIPGKVADPGNPKDFFGELGLPEGLGEPGAGGEEDGGMANTLGMISGGIGVSLIVAAKLGIAIPGLISGAITVMGKTVMAAKLMPFGGALAGAAIGVAVVSLLIKFLGIGGGLDPAITYTLMAAGVVGGALIGYTFMVYGNLWNPVGWALLAAALIAIAIFKLLGIGKVRKVTVSFSCQPWQAPTGGAKCGQCGRDAGNSFNGKALPCSRYACQALGQTCELINENTKKQACVDIGANDATAPVIKPLNGALFEGFSYADVSQNGFRIKNNVNEGCVKANTQIAFGIELNEPGQCRMDVKHTTKFNDMEFDFAGRNLFLRNHSMLYTIPSIESLGIPGYDPNRKAEYAIYVRCQDKRGNKNDAEYAINFCVKPGNDETAPVINAREPIYEYTAYNQTNVNATIYVNEPAECKYDSKDVSYDLMSNSMKCKYNIEEQELYGWPCSANLPVGNNDSTYFMRCKDQPWLVEDNGQGKSIIVVYEGDDEQGNPITRNVTLNTPRQRNVNTQSYAFNIKKSMSELKIDSLTPDDKTLSFGTLPVTVEIEAKTSGGADGNARCSFKNGDQYIDFLETFGNVHKQRFEGFSAGEREFKVLCEDLAGNSAQRTSRFNIRIDTDAPKITRVYQQSNSLTIVTDENAECFISKESCDFDIANATQMSGLELLHTADFDRGRANYVKCKDVYGNMPGSCNMAVKEGV